MFGGVGRFKQSDAILDLEMLFSHLFKAARYIESPWKQFLIKPRIGAVSYLLNDISNVADVSQPPKLMSTEPRNLIYLHRRTGVEDQHSTYHSSRFPRFRDPGNCQDDLKTDENGNMKDKVIIDAG